MNNNNLTMVPDLNGLQIGYDPNPLWECTLAFRRTSVYGGTRVDPQRYTKFLKYKKL